MSIQLPTLEAPRPVSEGIRKRGPSPCISAPVSGWRRLLGDWAFVGGAEMICQTLGAVTSLLLRMLLDPAQMGIWQAVKLVLSYASYANFGVSKGAARELTVALGRGDLAKATRGLDLAFTANTLSSLAYAVILIGAGVWIGLGGSGEWSAAWALAFIAGGALAALGRYVSFQVTILRARQAFVATSRLSLLEAVTTLAVGGACTWLWGLPGLYAGTLGVMLASLVYLSRLETHRFAFGWDRTEMRRLITIGSPMLLAGVVYSVFRSLDKLMILGCMSDREYQLGCYSLALMVATQLYGIGNMLSIVMGPRYGEKFGRCGDRRQVALLAARATELQAAAIALPAALALILAGPLLGRLLPDYDSGLAALQWLLPGVVALSLALPASQYLIAIDRQKRALAAVLAATALAAVADYVAIRRQTGLGGLAAATAVGYLVYFLLAARISLWPELARAERWRYAATAVLLPLPTLGLAIVLERTSPAALGDWPTILARIAAVLLVWGATVGAGWRHGGWRDALRRT